MAKKYKAALSLTWAEAYIQNDDLRDRFIDYGLKDVFVTGNGAYRVVEGVWPYDNIPIDWGYLVVDLDVTIVKDNN